MEPVDEYMWIMIAMVVSFIISLFVFFNAKRKWTGCILQFFTFVVLFLFSGLLFGICRGCVDSSNESEAMVGVRLVEDTRNCRYERIWWMKPDNTYYFIYDKGSNSHKVEPCGNDHFGDKGNFTRIDSLCAIKTDYNPPLVIYFDLDSQKVTPIWDKDTLEVISADWNRINDYFKKY